MIDESIAHTLKLTGVISPITYRWTSDVLRFEPNSKVVQLQIAGDKDKFYPFKNVRTAPDIHLPSQKIDVNEIVAIYPFIDKDLIESINEKKPMVLVGSNNAGLILPLQVIHHQVDGLQFTRCKLGKTIHGNVYPQIAPVGEAHVFLQSFEINEDLLMYHSSFSTDNALTDLVKEQFRLESYGLVDKEKLSQDDLKALEIMESTLKKIDGGYEIGQLYKYPNMPMPTNVSKSVAKKRLEHVEKRMDNDHDFANAYIQKIEDYVKKGYARKLESNEIAESTKTFYLPHFGVYNPNKPGNFRLVMDAKVKCGRYSLNDLLLQGPDFVPNLISIIWRARLKPICYVADIQEMFHRIKIRPEDQDSQRFLFRGTDRQREPDVYVMEAMIFGAKSSPSMAQYVKNENARRLETTHPGVYRPIKLQHYVDDFFDSANDENEAIKNIVMIDQAHQEGGFFLLKFNSNSSKVLQSIHPDRRAPECNANNPRTRVLGLTWNTASDEFEFDLSFPTFAKQVLQDRKPPTKRQLLSFLMGIFDPIGFLLPLTIKLKLIHQDLWRHELQWEDLVPASLFKRIQDWVIEANDVGTVYIPRWYFPASEPTTEAELYTFVDASDRAYAACCYLRLVQGQNIRVALVQAKSKVAPLKHVTVPRLELQAAVMGCQLARTVEDELGLTITKRRFWTDSRIVLSWLKTKERLGAYVGARATKVNEETEIEEWEWIPSEYNISDLGSKDLLIVNLSRKSEWLLGPAFLHLPEEYWPKFTVPPMTIEEEVLFMSELYVEAPTLLSTNTGETEFCLLPDANKFSEYSRLLNSTVAIFNATLRFEATLNKCRNKKTVDDASQTPQPSVISKFPKPLTDQLRYVENLWIKHVQQTAFSAEIAELQKTGFISPSRYIHKLSPMIHDGILRIDGRMKSDYLSFDEQNPIILPDSKDHRFVHLLIRHYHRRNVHQGHETVLNNLRQKFWIIGARQGLKRVIRLCPLCDAIRTVPRPVREGRLPQARFSSHVPPFTFTGVDHFGPIYITEGRKKLKVWGLLFVCMTSRAIHIELVERLLTSNTINALKRFMNIRGHVKKFFSDQGTSFTGSDNELKEFMKIFDHDKVAKELAALRMSEWSTNCPAAPHQGGSWERMVGLSKTVLNAIKAMTCDHFPGRETLQTALTEVINVVNNRPLSHISIDPMEPTPLTPNGLLLGRNNDTSLPIKYEDQYNLKRGHWLEAQVLADRWWHRWVQEIRPKMVRRTKWFDDKDDPYLKVGDAVYMIDENAPRGYWPKGIITAVFPGIDGRVRNVEVQTNNGIYKRPFTKVAKIKFCSAPEDVPDNI